MISNKLSAPSWPEALTLAELAHSLSEQKWKSDRSRLAEGSLIAGGARALLYTGHRGPGEGARPPPPEVTEHSGAEAILGDSAPALFSVS